jgi:hypothetical protein
MLKTACIVMADLEDGTVAMTVTYDGGFDQTSQAHCAIQRVLDEVHKLGVENIEPEPNEAPEALLLDANGHTAIPADAKPGSSAQAKAMELASGHDEWLKKKAVRNCLAQLGTHDASDEACAQWLKFSKENRAAHEVEYIRLYSIFVNQTSAQLRPE